MTIILAAYQWSITYATWREQAHALIEYEADKIGPGKRRYVQLGSLLTLWRLIMTNPVERFFSPRLGGRQ